MIKIIKIPKKEKTVPEGFTLELENMTVITGENNAGKTNFINAVRGKNSEFTDDKGLKVTTPKIVYIAAENIRPSDNELKFSATSTNLVTNLAELFSNLGFEFVLKDKEGFLNIINDIKSKANKNLNEFSGNKKHEVLIDSNQENLDSKTIIKELINSITVDEYISEDNKENRKLENLGQGTQRLIIASIIKAYLDILVDRKNYIDKPVLILFEEPEIYLHPRLKRTLNDTLEKISNLPNHQVIITTHDSYFVFPNFDGIKKKIVSFVKDENGMTLSPNTVIEGIEDELLFIFLFSRINKKDRDNIIIDGIKNRTYLYEDGKPLIGCKSLDYIRHQIHHSGDNHYTYRCGVTREDEIEKVKASGKNFYTQNELSEAVSKMSKIIGDPNHNINLKLLKNESKG
ncbi:MAG: AAA family ATPase [Minisyncoccia bacterium]